MTHGGSLAARALKDAGVGAIFTLTGGHIMPILDGALDEDIPVIDVRHEQAAVHAADAYSRLNPGRIGCAVLTAGPGVTDGVTGIANAWRANSPILVIGGQGPFSNLRRGSLQEMDHVGMIRPISKWADACYQTDRIPEYVEVAVRHAVAGVTTGRDSAEQIVYVKLMGTGIADVAAAKLAYDSAKAAGLGTEMDW